MTGADAENPTLVLPCRTVFAAGRRPVRVQGPFDIAEARRCTRDSGIPDRPDLFDPGRQLRQCRLRARVRPAGRPSRRVSACASRSSSSPSSCCRGGANRDAIPVRLSAHCGRSATSKTAAASPQLSGTISPGLTA